MLLSSLDACYAYIRENKIYDNGQCLVDGENFVSPDIGEYLVIIDYLKEEIEQNDLKGLPTVNIAHTLGETLKNVRLAIERYANPELSKKVFAQQVAWASCLSGYEPHWSKTVIERFTELPDLIEYGIWDIDEDERPGPTRIRLARFFKRPQFNGKNTFFRDDEATLLLECIPVTRKVPQGTICKDICRKLTWAKNDEGKPIIKALEWGEKQVLSPY